MGLADYIRVLFTAQILREEYGSDEVGFYSADTFNEMTPPSSDPAYLTSITNAIYDVRIFIH